MSAAKQEAEEWSAAFACVGCGGPAAVDTVTDPRGLVMVRHEAGCGVAVYVRTRHPGLFDTLRLPVRQGPSQPRERISA
jgi:hypothetical protein